MDDQEIDYLGLINRLNAGVYRNRPGSEGTFLFCNEAVEKLFGYTRAELYKLPVSNLYASVGERKKYEEEIRASGSIKGKRLKLKRKTGEFIDVEVTAIATYDDNTHENIKYYDGIVVDVTEEEEMYENISHQLSTPIIGIKTNAQRMLEKGNLDDKSKTLLKSIIGAAGISNFLAKNLDYMSKLIGMSTEAFQKRLTMQPIKPILINMIIDVQEIALQNKNIRIRGDNKTLDMLPDLFLDKTAIEMVVYCILDNAIKYSFEGTEINVNGFISGRYINVNFENEGIPIKSTYLPPNIPNIFMREMRTPEARGFITEGAGLGLFLSQKIMQLHNGTIIIEPSKNYKTTVRLAFPK